MAPKSILMRFPGGLAKALTLSYDDAVEQDFRLINIMAAHGLKGTFNINSSQYIPEGYVYPPEKKWGQRMTRERATELYSRDGIEHALHSYTHPRLQTMPAPQIAYEIIKDRETLEQQFGGIVRGMAYPYGTYNDDVIRVLRDCGIVYARTVHATHSFSLPDEWLTWHPTCHHADALLNELTQKMVNESPKNEQQPWLFYVWGHAYEFVRDDNWYIIENFADMIGGKDDIWYATNMEIYEYIENFKRLVFSLDEHRAYNPTAQTVCFMKGNTLYTVDPGQTICIND